MFRHGWLPYRPQICRDGGSGLCDSMSLCAEPHIQWHPLSSSPGPADNARERAESSIRLRQRSGHENRTVSWFAPIFVRGRGIPYSPCPGS